MGEAQAAQLFGFIVTTGALLLALEVAMRRDRRRRALERHRSVVAARTRVGLESAPPERE